MHPVKVQVVSARSTVDASIADNQPDPLDALPSAGSPGSTDPETERLSAIVDRLNEKHGYDLTFNDALLFEQFKGDWADDEDLIAAAFKISYKKPLTSKVRSPQNRQLEDS